MKQILCCDSRISAADCGLEKGLTAFQRSIKRCHQQTAEIPSRIMRKHTRFSSSEIDQVGMQTLYQKL